MFRIEAFKIVTLQFGKTFVLIVDVWSWWSWKSDCHLLFTFHNKSSRANDTSEKGTLTLTLALQNFDFYLSVAHTST